MSNYEKATKPTIYFIGVTTGSSSIMKVFPRWAKALGLKDAVIKGIDFKPHSDPQAYREAVTFIKEDPLSLGALVTTHKIDRQGSHFQRSGPGGLCAGKLLEGSRRRGAASGGRRSFSGDVGVFYTGAVR